MTTSFDSPLKLQQTGVDAADPGSVTLQTSPQTALPVWRGGGW